MSVPLDQRVLYEELPLGEPRAYREDALFRTRELQGRPGVGSVLRAAALKAVGVRDEDAPTGVRRAPGPLLPRRGAPAASSQLAPREGGRRPAEYTRRLHIAPDHCRCAVQCAALLDPPVHPLSLFPPGTAPPHMPDLELALSPSGRAAAVVELHRQRVKLLHAEARFAPAAAATFEPMPIEADGEESPDVITGVCWGPAAPGDGSGISSSNGGGAAGSGGGNGPRGERLLVACQSSCLYLLNRCATIKSVQPVLRLPAHCAFSSHPYSAHC
jgi:hypothetical protein